MAVAYNSHNLIPPRSSVLLAPSQILHPFGSDSDDHDHDCDVSQGYTSDKLFHLVRRHYAATT